MHWFIETPLYVDDHQKIQFSEIPPDRNAPPTEDERSSSKLSILGGSVELSSDTAKSVIAWKLLKNRRVLELRRLYITPPDRNPHAPEPTPDSLETDEAPRRFVFPHSVTSEPGFKLVQNEARSSLHVLVVTTVGTFYRLVFDGPGYFHVQNAHASMTSWQLTAAKPGRRAVLAHAADLDYMVIGWNDGAVTVLQESPDSYNFQAEENDEEYFHEHELRDTFLQKIFSFTGVLGAITPGKTSENSQSQAISITSFSSLSGEHLFAVIFYRDRQLKVWNLKNHSCVKRLSISTSSSHGANSVGGAITPKRTPGASQSSLLPTTPKQYIYTFGQKFIDIENITQELIRIAVFVPATESGGAAIEILEGFITENGQMGANVVCRKECFNQGTAVGPEQEDEFVNMAVVENVLGLGIRGNVGEEHRRESQHEWVVYTLWDRNHEAVVRYSDLVLSEDAAGHASAGTGVLGQRWMVAVTRGQESLTIPNLAQQLRVRGVQEVFADHILAPGRFSLHTITKALAGYEQAHPASFPRQPLGVLPTWDQLRRRALEVVGADVQMVEGENEDQSSFTNRHADGLQSEWEQFFANCMEVHEALVRPLSISFAPKAGAIAIVKRGYTSVLREADASEVVGLVGEEAIDPSAFILLPDDQLQSSYPAIAGRGLRTDINHFYEAVNFIKRRVGEDVLAMFEEDLIRLTKQQSQWAEFANSARDEFFADAVSLVNEDDSPGPGTRLVAILRRCGDVTGVYRNLLGLAQGEDQTLNLQRVGAAGGSATTALIGTGAGQVAESRFAIIRDLLLVVICAVGLDDAANMNGGIYPTAPSVRPTDQLVAECFVTFHGCHLLKWLCGRRVEKPELVGLPKQLDITAQFSNMSVSQPSGLKSKRDRIGGDTLALHLLRHQYLSDINFNNAPLGRTLRVAVARFIKDLGLTKSGQWQLIATKKNVMLAKKLLTYEHWEAARGVLEAVPLNPASSYLRGWVHLAREEWAEAGEYFRKAAAGFGQIPAQQHLQAAGPSSGPVVDATQPEEATLADVLVETDQRDLSVYYQRIMTIFRDKQVPEMTVAFANYALDQLSAQQRAVQKDRVTTLNMSIFNGSLDLLAYNDAYAALVAIEDPSTVKACLWRLITVAATNGELDLLCSRLPFIGLQEQVEKALEFQAKTGPVHVPGWNSETNYYGIMWGYFVFRGDFRRASKAMFDYARRLNSLAVNGHQPAKVQAIVTEQARALLAALNALTLVREENRWIVDENGDFGEERARKRRRIGDGPVWDDDEPRNSAPVSVLEPADLRREYLLVVSKLHTSKADPVLLQAVGVPDARTAMSMYLDAGLYDKALDLGVQFKLGVGKVFERVVEKCVRWGQTEWSGGVHAMYKDEDLTLTDDPPAGWEGTASEKAWRLLQFWLKKHDSKENGWGYYKCVVDRALNVDPHVQLPVWIKEFFKEHNPDDLLRIYIKYDLWERAAEFIALYIRENTRNAGDATNLTSASMRWIPYTLVDQILKGVEGKAVERELKERMKGWNEGVEWRTKYLLEKRKRGGSDFYANLG
ncbi:hypothetical protein HDV00_006340 [Rhizophlyctis rosea]|nr:hypothetical protein HDV00_006340 [Rhizophlyctis rosea]